MTEFLFCIDRDSHPSCIKSPNFSARGAGSPCGLLQRSLVILVRLQTSQLGCFGKWVEILCVLDPWCHFHRTFQIWVMRKVYGCWHVCSFEIVCTIDFSLLDWCPSFWFLFLILGRSPRPLDAWSCFSSLRNLAGLGEILDVCLRHLRLRMTHRCSHERSTIQPSSCYHVRPNPNHINLKSLKRPSITQNLTWTYIRPWNLASNASQPPLSTSFPSDHELRTGSCGPPKPTSTPKMVFIKMNPFALQIAMKPSVALSHTFPPTSNWPFFHILSFPFFRTPRCQASKNKQSIFCVLSSSSFSSQHLASSPCSCGWFTIREKTLRMSDFQEIFVDAEPDL